MSNLIHIQCGAQINPQDALVSSYGVFCPQCGRNEAADTFLDRDDDDKKEN